MQFNPTDKSISICADIDFWITGRSDVTSDCPIEDKTRLSNSALDRICYLILRSDNKWNWDDGTGWHSSGTNPVTYHTFDTAGTYHVGLRVRYNLQTQDDYSDIPVGGSSNYLIVTLEYTPPLSVDELFSQFEDFIIIKEIAGWKIYWPAMGINTLEIMEPGKAYFILMGNNVEIVFPNCD